MANDTIKFPSGIKFNDETLTAYDEVTSYSFTDLSGAGLSLTTNRIQSIRVGNLVTLNGVITYPVTASTSSALISVPVAPSVGSSIGAILVDGVTSGAILAFTGGAGFYNASAVRLKNSDLSGKTIYFTVTYPLIGS